MIRRKVKMVLAGRAEAAEQATPARLLRIKENPPEAVRRRIAMMRVMKEMKRKPARRSSRRPLMPYALTKVNPCTPLTASLKSESVWSMPWSQR